MVDPLGGPAYWWPLAAAFVAGYLIGSIPFGLLIAKLAGAGDIRTIGSGNIGATNVLRTGRKGLALATLVADILKGALPVWLAWRWLGPDVAVLTGLGAVVGHCFPVWLRFRGGKGVATAAGIVAVLTPLSLVVGLIAFIAVVAATRYVSLGSILASILVVPAAWYFGDVQAAELYAVFALIIVVKHASNIGRLIKGTESRLGQTKTDQAADG